MHKAVHTHAPMTGGSLPRPSLARHLGRMLLDALLPVSVYLLARRAHATEIHAILYAGCVPILSGLWSLRRGIAVSPTSMVVFAGFAVTLVAFLLGGSPQILLLRESLVTATLGLACLVSLPTPRPLMFFFARSLVAGGDRNAAASFTERLRESAVLHAFRVITFTWSATLLGEFGLRAWLVFHAPPATVLAISPILNNGVIFGTLSWAFWYGRRRHLIE